MPVRAKHHHFVQAATLPFQLKTPENLLPAIPGRAEKGGNAMLEVTRELCWNRPNRWKVLGPRAPGLNFKQFFGLSPDWVGFLSCTQF